VTNNNNLVSHGHTFLSLARHLPSVEVLGVRVHAISVRQLVSVVAQSIAQEERLIVAYVNAHALNLAYKLPWFRAFLNQSELVFCDGFGVKWGARLLGYHLPHRFTPPDWLGKLAQVAGSHGLTFFLLGARPGVAEKAAAVLQAQVPTLRVVGTHHGYFEKSPGHPDNEAVVQAINAARPDMLIVAFGMPTQEQWLHENWARLEAGAALTVGAAFDYLAGEVQRGPRWMTDHGLEWLSRLVVEPRRLWRRYLLGNPLFLWRVVRQRLGL
jgi:N-acetylglucosaminyldiphosphoundecaprenol N-acetyl-beta-D-mannosaminyltransferase